MITGHTTMKISADIILCFMCILLSKSALAQDGPQILDVSSKGAVGESSNLSCSVAPENATVEWLFNGTSVKIDDRIKQKDEIKALPEKDIDGNVRKYKMSNLILNNTTSRDAGSYTCVTKFQNKQAEMIMNLDLRYPGKLVKYTGGPIKKNTTEILNVTLQCIFELYNPAEVKWWKKEKDGDIVDLKSKPVKQINLKQIESTYELHIKRPEDNGTYVCNVWDDVTLMNISGEVDIIVYARPKVIIDTVKAISASQLYLNWTVHSYNAPIRGYNLMYRRLPSSDFNQYTREKIGIKNTSFVIEGLDNSTEYQIKLEVATSYGASNPYVYGQTVKTLSKDPIFVPNISINGFSATSVTIGWAPPPEDIAEFIHYYLLEARRKDETAPKRAYHSRDSRNLPYMFDDLEPHSTYIFRVCACSEFTTKCGNWSEEMEAVTLDGIPGKPSNVTVHCYQSDMVNHMNLTWQPPVKPNAEIKGYKVELTGNATFKNRSGSMQMETLEPANKFMANDSRSVTFNDLKPNTNYTVRLSAMTRTRRRGEEETRHCHTETAPPDNPPRPKWRKIMENNKYMFKMLLPRVSERNGPICCYRVYMVRLLPQSDWSNLPAPKDINIVTYEEAHSVKPALGAYVTDIFSNEKFPPESELVMGDNISMFDKDVCRRCLKKPKRHHVTTARTTPTTTSTTTEDDVFDEADGTTEPDVPELEEKRDRRSYNDNQFPMLDKERDYWKNPMMMDKPADEEEDIEVKDGPLDSSANYTLFVELIPGAAHWEPQYSEYVNVLVPAASAPAHAPLNTIELGLQITCVVAALILLIMIVICIKQTHNTRKMQPHAHVEMNPIQAALRYVVGHIGGRQQLVSTVPPDLPPIAKEDLAAAYAERQVDSDYGFQKEFELLQMLPDCFPDRTTHASEARENQPKNRYPDIKAYDQTRVKLSQIDSITGSDYINANYVMGYKERKRFICAQGPTETTVNDFWRMIWEHDIELIVMLTNLEEYSKVKCSKYWPDEVRGARAFGNITVNHVAEKRYSDYIVRELKISKQQTNADFQPILENNGISHRNGDCKDVEAGSVPTSPRENKDVTSRIVKQYHFLMWKDFAAPEYPQSILKFIKRVNEAWSVGGGWSRPAVVHCSAGVGRTGTLVALDVLLDQLRQTGQITIFNTIGELRRQRNYLVQSLKQYVFVYRALVEYAHFGDTEISAGQLKSATDRLRNTPDNADKCLMEHEFEKIMKSPVAEPVKSCAAALAEEARVKNRSQDCVPYDRNRVILSPLPARDLSTYINASFLEAYDNSEGFIITQDPLPNTIMDFWRMVSEHNVSTIVMLSELGESKCPRYWDDGTATYEHISVQYEESESCPYYTRRQFRVVNNKSGEVSVVRQLQYQGWPTAPGHVPEVTRGVAELADAANPAAAGVMLVHCALGTQRAPLFVALCVLIGQLRAERRLDVSSVARRVRCQRARSLDTFLQYEFLYRAILNYAELHNLLEDS